MKEISGIVLLLLFITAVHSQTINSQSKPYSNYTEHNGLIFVSGQIVKVDSSFDEEVHHALKNVNEILKQAGTSMKKVLNVTVYLRDIKQIEAFNNIYRKYFQYPFPARTCIAVSDLVQHVNVEISVVAGK